MNKIITTSSLLLVFFASVPSFGMMTGLSSFKKKKSYTEIKSPEAFKKGRHEVFDKIRQHFKDEENSRKSIEPKKTQFTDLPEDILKVIGKEVDKFGGDKKNLRCDKYYAKVFADSERNAQFQRTENFINDCKNNPSNVKTPMLPDYYKSSPSFDKNFRDFERGYNTYLDRLADACKYCVLYDDHVELNNLLRHKKRELLEAQNRNPKVFYDVDCHQMIVNLAKRGNRETLERVLRAIEDQGLISKIVLLQQLQLIPIDADKKDNLRNNNYAIFAKELWKKSKEVDHCTLF